MPSPATGFGGRGHVVSPAASLSRLSECAFHCGWRRTSPLPNMSGDKGTSGLTIRPTRPSVGNCSEVLPDHSFDQGCDSREFNDWGVHEVLYERSSQYPLDDDGEGVGVAV